MGWWHHGILGGDAPMDTLGFLGDRIGMNERMLYPLNMTDKRAATVRRKLEAVGDGFLTEADLGNDEALPVLAAVFLHAGAAIPDILKARMLEAVHKDVFGGPEWGDGENDRKAVMDALAAALEAHVPGKRHDIENKGLFEAMADAPGLANRPKDI